MKIKAILKKYKLSSNSSVIIEEVKSGDMVELTESNLRNLEPQYIMDMKVNSIDIVDNVFTIYVE